jgi:hypothetical protein
MAPRDGPANPTSGRTLILLAAGSVLTLGFQQLFPSTTNANAGGVGGSALGSIVGGDGGECASQAVRIGQLEQSLNELRMHARSLQQQRQQQQQQGGGGTPASAATSSSGAIVVSPSATSGSSPSPPTRQFWSWTGLVMNTLRPFEKLNGGITLRGLRLAEQKCKISTWCHRAQVIDGRLYITDLRAIFFDRHYAMARVMPLLLAMKRFPVPDLDAVFSGTDYPIMEIPRDAAHMSRMYGAGAPIPPVFSPTANTVSHDIPWPDFSFFPPLPNPACGAACNHPLKTPRWQLAHKDLLALGRKLRFDEKIDRAVFTGNMKTSPNRRWIFNQAEVHPELLFVNEVYIKESPPSCFKLVNGGPHPNVTNGGVLVKKCGLSFEELCRYKYLLNVGSNGYANKLKYLFLTGSVVIWVRKDSLNYEFFEHQFVPNVHYVAVDTVEEVRHPPTLTRPSLAPPTLQLSPCTPPPLTPKP